MSSPGQAARSRQVEIDIGEPPVFDVPTVTPAGERLETLIEGVEVRGARVQTDARGSLTEIFNPEWGFTEEPLVYLYQSTLRVGITKGWVIHYEQDDRLFFDNGDLRVVLYDARVGSPTQGLVNELFFGSTNRALLRIPAGVFHALTNVGETEARFVNLPTRPYRHGEPDKARLARDTAAIPYRL